MARKYRHVKEYEEEILEMREQGKSRREICERFGFSLKQLVDFITRYNREQKKLALESSIKPKGRPRKRPLELPQRLQHASKISQLQYEIASNERRIKRLEMENELMRDFLSLAGRK